ncbi:breast cancer type 1 susceptibility protein homolog [Vanessa cardui]|uniref:breast cancer type 1 susceptibility protein homolog n=1 Tax=Vanessa cardui TaxID=171605 RepID=UPI001F148BEE|nr:breast cancer type 1 susceptibility protein homolog [Vanessa cardui]
MIFKNLDINKLSRLSSQQVDHVTCIECCKYYVIPTTATCGHTLCHSCWRGRRTCPFCSVQVEKKNLKLNLPLQTLKEHVQLLANAFEDLFNVKLDEFSLDPPIDKESEDSNKHVKEWLASSQNHFSAPVTDSQQSIIGQSIEQVTSNILIHSEKKGNPKSIDVVHVPPVQVDWDKIEEMPEIASTNKNLQNPVGPMDIEPFDFIDDDDKDYSTENPRRSSRNKENRHSHSNKASTEITSDKNSGKGSNLDSDNKSHKLGKNWNNVKRMKKEFSKLNKKNRNKLNVSIEMCKKTQTIANKAVMPNSQHNILYDIDDNTPEANLCHKENSKHKNIIEEVTEEISIESNKQKDKDITNSYSNNSRHSKKEQICVDIKDKPAEDELTTKTMHKDNVNNQTLESQRVCFFKKSALNKVETLGEKNVEIEPNENSNANTVNNDDIEITIKIGNTLTNICIKKKDNDVQFKINSEREIQTSPENAHNNNNVVIGNPIMDCKSQNTNIIEDMQIDKVHDDNNIIKCTSSRIQILEKSTSTKKNTASADTATGNFEITESVERELTDILDNAQCINNQNKNSNSNSASDNNGQTKINQPTTATKVLQGIPEDMEYLNDLDIFDGESVKEGKVQSLKASKNTPSAILMPTVKSNIMKSLKDKRERESPCLDDIPSTKKIKLTHESVNIDDKPIDTLTSDQNKVLDQDSENINYDAIMSQVFANIDADMGHTTKTSGPKQATQNSNSNKSKIAQTGDTLHKTQDKNDNKHDNSNKDITKEYANQKYSENVFSIIEKDISDSELLVSSKTKISTQIHNEREDSVKTAKAVNVDNIKSFSQESDIEVVELSTPLHDDDSDKSIVEETPQKSTSLLKNKSKNEITIVSNTQQLLLKDNKKPITQLHKTCSNVNRGNEDPVNVLSLSDTLGDTTKTSKNVTVVETVQPRPTMETPLTITKFVDQIKHKSTPMARKSLNFNSQNAEEDPEQTLCPSSFVAAKTTQEKEFLQRAFDQTQNSPIQSLETGKNFKRPVKLCVGGSCLSSSEHANLKLLCLRRNWTFVDKYCKELTHLVVGVDEENKSQRSVKYMCALAGAKWIVSYEWVEKCLQTNNIVDEEPFEALDGTGEPGPRRSRVARLKLFQGITFYCMPPFTVLDVQTLKDILESAGGRVVSSPRDVRAAAAPALLLAEPERTQDDKFTYLAMELSIVPVNYEWVLNCLGSYTLGSIYELLLCPASLIPPVTSSWPPELISRDYE